MSSTPLDRPLDRGGVGAALAAYLMWGVFPLYWVMLKQVPALQIIAHRILWCGVLVVGWLLLRDGRSWLRIALAQPRVGLLLLMSSVFISINWGLYIWAVTNGHVVEASLGYFINPLISVLLGVLVFKERLNRRQWSAVMIAAAGVLWLAFIHGDPPWIALVLAGSFALYGMIRKIAAVDALPGLAIESLLLFVPALGWLAWVSSQGSAVFGQGLWRQDAMLIVGGALTALPLIGFAYAARRIPYSLVGILQYIAPTIQLLCGVLILGEAFSGSQAIGFGCIWLALAIYAGDGWRRSRVVPPGVPEPHCDEHVPPSDGGATPVIEQR